TYKGKGYSVPPQFINQRVKILNIEDKLYLYSNTELITVHTISQQPFNYREDHYREALKKSIYNKEIDIEEVAKENLALLEQLGGKQ
ncbi:Mu transposase domain-containing protein, partial [Anaerorhabdus sp.]|uniref:Mu transposase domain-containing protein n=1 Tax=Anaerorhabdus sp. TaxID=1872524 RepID=UPI003A9C6427